MVKVTLTAMSTLFPASEEAEQNALTSALDQIEHAVLA